jgi:hypothetical protein
MSDDSFTETTNESWFSRLGRSFKNVIIGIILFVAAFPLLFWNEGRAVKRYKALEEGSSQVISVDISKVDAANNGKLVHVTGNATTNESLSDASFGVTASAIKLVRQVEMFQWKENTKSKSEKKLGGGKKTVKTYTYEKTWSNGLISSSNFKKSANHTNPASMPYESTTYKAKNVSLGSYSLSPSLISGINKSETLDVDTLPSHLTNVQIHNNGYYIGFNPQTPAVGDVRITYKVVKPQIVSVVSKQNGHTFESFVTSSGETIQLIQEGTHSAANMFQSAQSANSMMTWAFRALGFLMMLIGLNMFFKPFSVMADVLPILGDFVAMGTGLLSFLISAISALITICIAWFVYRPILGVILLVVIGGLIFGLFKMKSKKKQALASAA